MLVFWRDVVTQVGFVAVALLLGPHPFCGFPWHQDSWRQDLELM